MFCGGCIWLYTSHCLHIVCAQTICFLHFFGMCSTLTLLGHAHRPSYKSPPMLPWTLNLSLATSACTECSLQDYQPMLLWSLHMTPCNLTRPCTASITSSTNLFVALPDVSLVTIVSPGCLLFLCPKQGFMSRPTHPACHVPHTLPITSH